jgi:hypothetical protein
VQRRAELQTQGLDGKIAARQAADESLAKITAEGGQGTVISLGKMTDGITKEAVVGKKNSMEFVFRNEVATKTILKWIFENIGNRGPKVGICGAPSMGAWNYLKEIRKDKELKRDFYKLWAKMIAGEDVQSLTAGKSDGLGLIDEIEARLNADAVGDKEEMPLLRETGAKDSQGQSEFPAGNLEDRVA